MATKKYNPGFLSDDELVESFCVRKSEFESIVETLRENTGNSNQHMIVIGPRGSGKTSLLLRVAIETRRNPDLSSRIFPITFAEESYEISTCGEFWLECLSRLVDQAPQPDWASDLGRSYQDLRATPDDRMLADRCLAALLDFSDRAGKRLLLTVENLNMMFADMLDPDAGWRLRKTLQTEPRIMLLGSATSRFAEIDRPDRAMYDLFRLINLRPLDERECGALWETVSGELPENGKVRSLQILTGGSPRLIAIVAPFGTGRPLHELMADLLDLIDEHTEYFRGHLDALASQERRVYLALADLWKPATTREIADRARLGSSTCSAQLSRLISRGVVSDEGGTPRRRQYYLVERLYNVYYLLRRRGSAHAVDILIQFMMALYSHRKVALRVVADAAISNAGNRDLYLEVLDRLSQFPAMTEYRDVFRWYATGLVEDAKVSKEHASVRQWSPLERCILDMVADLQDRLQSNKCQDALDVCDQIVTRVGSTHTPLLSATVLFALLNKGEVMVRLARWSDALEVYDDLLSRSATIEHPEIETYAARAMASKAILLAQLTRSWESLEICEETVRRFGANDAPAVAAEVARALVWKGVILSDLGQPSRALEALDFVVNRFAARSDPEIGPWVALALMYKGDRLIGLGRVAEALEIYDDAVRRYESGRRAAKVAEVLMKKGVALGKLNRLEEELEVYEELVRRHGASGVPEIAKQVAAAAVRRGVVLSKLNRQLDALEVYDDVLGRFGASDAPGVVDQVSIALLNKGDLLGAMNRYVEALQVYTHIRERFAGTPSVAAAVGVACLYKGLILGQFALAESDSGFFDEAVKRFGNVSACEQDLSATLTFLAGIDDLPGPVIHALMFFIAYLEPARAPELIQHSGAADLLLPLVTALHEDLGLKPRVAWEVKEVAHDIRKELAKLRRAVHTSNTIATAHD